MIAQGFGSGYDGTESLTSDIAAWLNTAGYVATPLQGAKPADLRTAIKNMDVLLYTGHGGLGYDNLGATGIFGISTAVVSSPQWNLLHPQQPLSFPQQTADDLADFANHRLIYMIDDVANDSNGLAIPGTWWAFTGAFVEQYMSFNPGSLVVINACNSASNTLTVISQGFPASFKAGTYLGWNGLANDLGNDRIRYVFDRLLGEIPGGGGRTGVTQESPPQRAFNLTAVLNDMTAQGLIPLSSLNPGIASGGNLVPLGPNDAILAPSIAFIYTDESSGLLNIAGIFDPNRKAYGRVTVSGQDCPIQGWSADHVSCSLPASGSGSEGQVIVGTGGIDSNAVMLTSWRGAFTYDITGGGSLQATATFDTHWRSDIHTWRIAPHTTPQHYPFVTYFASDSTATWNASGSQSVPGMPPVTVTISGGGSLPWASSSTAGALNAFGGGVILDVQPNSTTQWTFLNAIALNDIAASGNGCTQGAYSFELSPLTVTMQPVTFYVSPPPLDGQQASLLAMPLKMDASYNLLDNQFTNGFPGSCPYSILGGESWSLTWPLIAPTNPPDPNAAQ
jgi:hypothetical protein